VLPSLSCSTLSAALHWSIQGGVSLGAPCLLRFAGGGPRAGPPLVRSGTSLLLSSFAGAGPGRVAAGPGCHFRRRCSAPAECHSVVALFSGMAAAAHTTLPFKARTRTSEDDHASGWPRASDLADSDSLAESAARSCGSETRPRAPNPRVGVGIFRAAP
jgi:hypothetical protein